MDRNPKTMASAFRVAQGKREAIVKRKAIVRLGITPNMGEKAIEKLVIKLAQAKAIEKNVKYNTLLNGQQCYVESLVAFSALTSQEQLDAEYEKACAHVVSEDEMLVVLEEDIIINGIKKGEINSEKISFCLIRKASADHGIHHELHYGHAILENQKQLNQYWYSYGPMTRRQWEYVWKDVVPATKLLKDSNKNIEVIDYACGQGMASMLFFDENPWARDRVQKITLIEPSRIALNRAETILQLYVPNAKIRTIEKILDDITEPEIQTEKDAIKIHLFSNILDIPSFGIPDLLNKILENLGFHYIFAVSHARDSHGGTERMREAYKILADKQSNIDFIHKPEIQPFDIPSSSDCKPVEYLKAIVKV